jgi:hypothetical protein
MPESTKSNSPDKTWEIYAEIGAAERHFNQLEHQYRVLASTWLLGTFVAFGYVLIHLPLRPDDWVTHHRDLVIAGIALSGALGIRLIWILDIRVYHQLLESCFLEGLKLERDNDWLPRIRHNMVRTQRTGSVTPNIVWFYIGCTTVLLVIAAFSASLWFYQLVEHPASWVSVLFFSGLTYVWGSSMYRISFIDASDPSLKQDRVR